jgi:hypothetical protein
MPATLLIFDAENLPTTLHFELKLVDKDLSDDSVDVLTVHGGTKVGETRPSSIAEIDALLSLGNGNEGRFAGERAVRADYLTGRWPIERYQILVRTNGHADNEDRFIDGNALETALSQLRTSAKTLKTTMD